MDGDSWNELATIRTDGSELLQIFDFNSPYYDLDAWMGNWSSDGEYIILTRVYYGSYNGQYYIGDMDIYTLRLSSGEAKADLEFDLTSSPDWYQLDAIDPVSALHPLPEYTRGTGVDLYWDMSDDGPSGIFQIKIQERMEDSSDWIKLSDDYTIITNPPISAGVSCKKAYFRARAEDHAENWEDWPADPGEVWTTFYRANIYGQVIDNRTNPLPLATISFDSIAEPLVIQQDGTFHVYNCNSTAAQIFGSLLGYGSWPVRVFTFSDPFDLGEFYLPPSQNVILNGDFSSTTGWTKGGILLPESVTAPGWGGMRFGNMLLKPDPVAIDDPDEIINSSVLRISSDGTRYAAWVRRRDSSGTPGVFYARQLPGQVWSTPIEISDPSQIPLWNGVGVQMQVDSDNDVSIIWLARTDVTYPYDDHRYVYREVSGEGIWSDSIYLSEVSLTSIPDQYKYRLYMDGNDYVHAVWNTDDGLWYRLRLPDGTWQSVEQINTTGFAKFSAAVSDLNKFILLYMDGNAPPVLKIQRTGDSAWSMPVSMPGEINNLTTDGLDIKDDGGLMMVWVEPDPNSPFLRLIKFTEMVSADEWSIPLSFSYSSSSAGTPNLLIDDLNRVHLLCSDKYWLRKADGTWPYQGVPVWPGFLYISINPTTQLPESMAHHAVYIIELPDMAESSLSQTITIPADVHKPTLAFNYYHPYSTTDGVFTATIDGETVFTGVMTSKWEMGWADLTPWVGHTVELRFHSEFDPFTTRFMVYVDNVSVGEWVTPIITSVSPNRIEQTWSGQMITITGENFICPVVVKIGTQVITTVDCINETTLQITLPGDLPPGNHTILVTNPEGQAAVRPAALLLGRQYFLPVMMR